MANVKSLKVGTKLLDHRARSEGRIVILKQSDNPAGADIGPWWQVENEETGRQTLIREDTFAGSRWSNLSVENDDAE